MSMLAPRHSRACPSGAVGHGQGQVRTQAHSTVGRQLQLNSNHLVFAMPITSLQLINFRRTSQLYKAGLRHYFQLRPWSAFDCMFHALLK